MNRLLYLVITSLCVTQTVLTVFRSDPPSEPAAPVIQPAPVVVELPLPTEVIPALPAPPPPPSREWKVPRSLIDGILYVETRSILNAQDAVSYKDRRRGAHGERGPTQLRRIAFDQVSRPGESFARVETDPSFAIEITERYLLWLRARTTSWKQAVRAYNGGLGGQYADTTHRYWAAVTAAGAR